MRREEAPVLRTRTMVMLAWGVADPLEKIHMVGNLKLDGHAGVIFNTPNATSDPYNYIAFKREDEMKWLIDYGTVQTNNLRFLRFSGGQFKTYLNFDYDNFEFEILNTKVGIGTSLPAFQLHINDPIGGAALGLERNGKLWRFDLDGTQAGKIIHRSYGQIKCVGFIEGWKYRGRYRHP